MSMIKSIPSARYDRWALLESIAVIWGHSIGPEDGYSPQDVISAEDRLGFSLPTALREWYLYSARRKDLWSSQDTLLPPERLVIEEGILGFYVENQAVVEWGIRLDDLHQEDPPVVVRDVDEDTLWHVENGSTTEFALQMFVSNLKWSSRNSCDANGEASARVTEAIANAYARLPFPNWRWPTYPTFLLGADEIVIEQNGDGDRSWLWVCSRTERAFHDLETLIAPLGMQWTERHARDESQGH